MCSKPHETQASRRAARPIGAWVCALVLLVLLALQGSGRAAWAGAPVLSCFFAGTTTDGSLFVATSPDDISGSQRVVLEGVVPTHTTSAYNRYVQRMLGGYLLHVRVKGRLDDRAVPTLRGEVMIVQGNTYVNLNKALLRDGYGTLAPQAPAAYRPFAAYAQRKGIGVWAQGRPVWVTPPLPRDEAVAGTALSDRDKVIERHGIPTYTNRTLVPDSYSVLQYHLYLTDFYLQEGLVYIYRDGKLINRQVSTR